MILSITEGDDKPLKYPLMFKESDVVVFSKIDALPVFDFNIDLAKSHIKKLNDKALVFPVSAKTGEGMDAIAEYILNRVKEIKNK